MLLIQSFNADHIENINKDHFNFTKRNHLKAFVKMAVLSNLLLRENYPTNPVRLFSDNKTYQRYFKHIPELKCEVLNDFTNVSPTHIWTRTKLGIIKAIKEPLIHIDNDIFIKKTTDLSFKDIIVERNEDATTFHWYKGGIKWIDKWLTHAFLRGEPYTTAYKYWTKEASYAYNTGLLGFSDINRKDLFCDFYYDLENCYSYYLREEAYWEQIFIVLEQYSLVNFAKIENLHVKTFVGGDLFYDSKKEFSRKGYDHFFGERKYKSDNILWVDRVLKNKYPEIHERLNLMK